MNRDILSPNGTPTIVVVDDEEVVTQTIRSFLALETNYDVHTFQSPTDALKRMDGLRTDLVISDFLMPGMNGLEFLAEVRKLYPDAVRILLTGYADKENAIRGINEVDLFQYLEKPWDNDHLSLVIKNGLRQKSLDAQLQGKIRDLDRTLLERDRIAQKHDALREELTLARRVQEALLPPLAPLGNMSFQATYLPALDVGGDFYDVTRVADGRAVAIVADATGHGIQAALSTTLLKSAFTEVTSQVSSPREILLRMNDIIHRVLPSDLFVAATVATIDTGDGNVCIAGGGGPHPLHLRRGQGDLEQLVCNGLPLGVVESSVYPEIEEIRRELAPGDAVLIYTDGITEVENDRGEEFGDIALKPGLRDLLSGGLEVPDMVAAIVDSARKFAVKGHQWDDVTVLALNRGR